MEAAPPDGESLERDGIATVIAHIHPHHVASQRIATALGLRPTDAFVDGEVRWIGDLSPEDPQPGSNAAALPSPVSLGPRVDAGA